MGLIVRRAGAAVERSFGTHRIPGAHAKTDARATPRS